MVYDFNTRKVKLALDAAPILAAIDAGLMAEQERPREYLGASQIGDECARRIQYDLLAAPGEPFDPRTKRIFARGHIVETLVAKWLCAAGFFVSTHKPDGGQHGFATAQGRFRGHVDGVLLSGPAIEGLVYPALWENKAVGAKSFADIQRRGVATARPVYADQISVYQAYLNLPGPALFTAVNCDDMSMHVELVPYDAARAQRASDRAVHIIRALDANELLPRVAGEATSYPCTACRYREHCWK